MYFIFQPITSHLSIYVYIMFIIYYLLFSTDLQSRYL